MISDRTKWITAGLGVLGWALAKQLGKLWVKSQPSEWVLVIEDGKLIKAGVGLKTFALPTQTVVKFPSTIYKVNFNASNVTKEMQGVEVSGFAIWSIFRKDDGPFRYYKSTSQGGAEDNIRNLCESIVRSSIANTVLKDLLQNRNQLREKMRQDLQSQLTGWGVWLETVEINDIRISSNSLFEDLQADFRQSCRLKATEIKRQVESQIQEQNRQFELEKRQHELENETEMQKCRNEQTLKKLEEEAKFKSEQNAFLEEERKLDHETDLLRKELEAKEEMERLSLEQKLKQMDNKFKLEWEKKFIEANKQQNETSLQKQQIETTNEIFQSKYTSMNINSYSHVEDTNQFAQLLGLKQGN